MPWPIVFLTINGSENANSATTTPITPNIKACLACINLSGLSWAVINNMAATINAIMAKATTIGHKMLNITSIRSPTRRLGMAFGTPPELKAKPTTGKVNRIAKLDKAINFLFISQMKKF